ncbi:MAG: glycosyltransferase [Myxococcaceae bacterium]|nr:glycosyltransferase [Myxococcaceae bacterium]
MSQDGLTDHIGQSQVVPYLIGLAKLGYQLHIVSAEKEGREQCIQEHAAKLSKAGIAWTRTKYSNRIQIFDQFRTQCRLYMAVRRLIQNNNVEFLHCRSHPAAIIGFLLKKRFRIKYIFDFRDFYADCGIEKSIIISRMIYLLIKKLEPLMLNKSDYIVCLTERSREILVQQYPSLIAKKFQTIPCCADFTHFDPQGVSTDRVEQIRKELKFSEHDFILVYLGSLGFDYLLSEMLYLFKELIKINDKSNFLFILNNGFEAVEREANRLSLPLEKIQSVSVQRAEIPDYLALADMSVVFIRSSLSKAGCSPTKLAELFASNIPVIANAGVGDLDAIIDPEQNGSVLVKDFSPAALRTALIELLEMRTRKVSIRKNSFSYSLETGVSLYAGVYAKLLEDECLIS